MALRSCNDTVTRLYRPNSGEARIPRRYRKYQAPLPDMSRYWNQPNMAAWLNAHRYRKYRPYVLGCVLAFMLVRRLRGR